MLFASLCLALPSRVLAAQLASQHTHKTVLYGHSVVRWGGRKEGAPLSVFVLAHTECHPSHQCAPVHVLPSGCVGRRECHACEAAGACVCAEGSKVTLAWSSPHCFASSVPSGAKPNTQDPLAQNSCTWADQSRILTCEVILSESDRVCQPIDYVSFHKEAALLPTCALAHIMAVCSSTWK